MLNLGILELLNEVIIDNAMECHRSVFLTTKWLFGCEGLCRSPWVKKHAMAMGQIQEQSSGLTSEVSPGHSVGHSPSRVAWDLHTSGPSSPSHHTVIFAFNIFQALL